MTFLIFLVLTGTLDRSGLNLVQIAPMERFEKYTLFIALAYLLVHHGEIIIACTCGLVALSNLIMSFFEWRRDRAIRKLERLKSELLELKSRG